MEAETAARADQSLQFSLKSQLLERNYFGMKVNY